MFLEGVSLVIGGGYVPATARCVPVTSRSQWQLAELGFDAFTVYYEPRPDLPLVYGSTRGDLELELGLVDYDPAGKPVLSRPY